MCDCNRRTFLAFAAGACAFPAFALDATHTPFVAEAARMRAEAVARGDQGYGAVVVRSGVIVDYGPSRVITDRNPAPTPSASLCGMRKSALLSQTCGGQ